MIRLPSAGLLLALLLTSCSSAQPGAGPTGDEGLVGLEAAIDAVVHDEMASNHVPGAAVVVVRDGRTIFKRGYGMADVEAGTPVDPDRTLFRIGSISKALTGLGVTRLVDDGRLAWDDDVSVYAPWISNQSGSDDPVTLWNLVTHTGGFDQIGTGRQIGAFDRPLAERKTFRPSLAAFLEDGNLRRVTPPGRQVTYDTYGMSLAGLVVARATGLSYAEAMRREVFLPLGMDRTFVEADEDHVSNLAIGYGWVDGEYVAQPYELYTTTPASSIDATVADMGRLMEALTGKGANGHGRLFSEAAASAVLATQFRPHPDFVGITHGFFEFPAESRLHDQHVRSVTHGGSMLGYSSRLTLYPESNVAVFVVANRAAEAGGGRVTLGNRVPHVVAEHLVEPSRPNPPRPASAQEGLDLADYVGDYVYGVYCHTCTDEEFERGAWRPSAPKPVLAIDGTLRVGDEVYLPTAEADVFVRDDGGREVFFGRSADGEVAFFAYSTSADTFERAVE